MSGVPDTLAALSLAVLAIGAGLGLVSRLILRRRSSMSLAGTILAGILGSVVGAVIAQVVTGNPGDPRIGAVLLFSVIGTVTVLLLAERFVGRSTPTALELIHAGESFHVEFKSTARHNLRSGQRDDRIEAAIAKTVVGFLNASGGTLLIGVDDKGSVLGLDDDLAHLKEPTLDQYELWLHDYLTRVLGGSRRCPAPGHLPDPRGKGGVPRRCIAITPPGLHAPKEGRRDPVLRTLRELDAHPGRGRRDRLRRRPLPPTTLEALQPALRIVRPAQAAGVRGRRRPCPRAAHRAWCGAAQAHGRGTPARRAGGWRTGTPRTGEAPRGDRPARLAQGARQRSRGLAGPRAPRRSHRRT